MRTRWEYTCCSTKDPNLNYTDLIEHLNGLGREGWELVGIASPMSTSEAGRAFEYALTYWFKRPLD
jgi:hypothetical protein